MINLKNLKKIHINIYCLGFASFLMNFAASIIYTTMMIFIGGKNNILSNTTLVTVRTLSEALANFSKIFSGFISDKIQNRKIFFYIGYGAMIFIKICFLLLTFPNLFPIGIMQIIYIFTQIFDRCINAIRDPSRDAVIIESSNESNRGLCFGIRKFITSSGSIIGGIITGILVFLSLKGFNNLLIFKIILFPTLLMFIILIHFFIKNKKFLILSLVCLLFLYKVSNILNFSSLIYMSSIIPVILANSIIITKIYEEKKQKITSKEIINFNLLKNNFSKIKSIFFILIIMCVLVICKLNDLCIFKLGIEKFQMPSYFICVMFAVMYFIITIFSYIFGILIDKKYNFLTMIITICSLILGNLFLGFSINKIFFWIGLIFNGIFLSANDSAMASIIACYIPSKEIKATIYGLIYGVSGFMGLINFFLLTFLQKKYSLTFIFKISTLPLLFLIFFLFFIKNYFKSK